MTVDVSRVTKGITNGGIVSKKIVVSYVIVPLK
jgi:hypothetical protein